MIVVKEGHRIRAGTRAVARAERGAGGKLWRGSTVREQALLHLALNNTLNVLPSINAMRDAQARNTAGDTVGAVARAECGQRG